MPINSLKKNDLKIRPRLVIATVSENFIFLQSFLFKLQQKHIDLTENCCLVKFSVFFMFFVGFFHILFFTRKIFINVCTKIQFKYNFQPLMLKIQALLLVKIVYTDIKNLLYNPSSAQNLKYLVYYRTW